MNVQERITKDKYKSIVYISHPFQNKQKNLDEVTKILQMCQRLYPDYLFISPVNMYSSLYDAVDYETGLKMCLCLLDSLADECWVFGDYQSSDGCVAEIFYCDKIGVPYIIKDFAQLEHKYCKYENTTIAKTADKYNLSNTIADIVTDCCE